MMQRTLFAGLLCAALISTDSSFVNAREPQSGSAITVTQATTRRLVVDEAHKHEHDHDMGRNEVRISIVWNSATPPAAIYYRADAAHWLKCKATRPERRPFGGGGPNDYMMVENHVQIAEIHKGDNVNLSVEAFPSEVQPDAVKKMATGVLFYQTGDSKKWYVQKLNMTKLPDARL